MPQPSINQVHVDAILTNISVAYMQRAENFIADKVFPIVPVSKKSDLYYTYTKNDWFRDEAQRRADATESAGSGYGISTASYAAEVYAIHKDVGDQTVANADAPLNPLREAAEFVTHRLLLRRELQFVTDFFGTSVWDTDVAGVTSSPTSGQFRRWSDYVNSDPLNDVEEGKAKILSTTGQEANTLVLGYNTFRYLRNHPEIVDRVKYTSAQTITTDLLARMFEVDNIYVAKAIKATNAEGATGAYSFAYGNHALLAHVANAPGLLTPSAGYCFSWTGVSGGLGGTVGTSQFRMDSIKATRVEAEMAWDNKVVSSDLGYFFSDAVS